MAERLHEFDILRSVAALSVIAIHVTSGYVTTTLAGFLWNQAMRYAVPMFIILSGFLLSHGDRSRDRFWGKTTARRLGRLITPYIIWTLVYTAFYTRLDPAGFASDGGLFAGIGKRLLLGTASAHLYFIPITIQMYLLHPVILRLMDRSPRATLGAAFLVTFYFQLADYGYQYGLRLVSMRWLRYGSTLFPVWLFYFVAGAYAARYSDALKDALPRRRTALGIVYVSALAALITDTRLTNTFATSIKPTVMLYCVAAFLFFYSVAKRAVDSWGWIKAPAQWLSLQSFLIYFSHVLILNVLQALPRLAFGRDIWAGIWGMAALYICTVALSVLAAFAVSLTPFAKYLGGVPKEVAYQRPKQPGDSTGARAIPLDPATLRARFRRVKMAVKTAAGNRVGTENVERSMTCGLCTGPGPVSPGSDRRAGR